MKLKPLLLITAFFFAITFQLNAQTKPVEPDNSVSKSAKKNIHQLNFIKTNLTGIVFKNYSLQYERVLTRKFSIAVSFRTMPSTTIPFKNKIISLIDANDPDTKETIEKLRLSNIAITPEVRLYLSKKGFGRGFYIAPFYRYAKFKTNNLIFTYEDNLNVKSTINLSGDLTSNTGGLLFGVQKFLGKHICLDFWLFGPHYGSGVGNFTGVSSKPLTQQEQDDLRQQLENLDIPLTKKTVTVTANGASLKLDGPWAGIRSGLSIGVKF